MSFYILENTQHNYVKIHRGSCPSCKCGKGPIEGHTGNWSSEFQTYQQALNASRKINRPLANHCKRCHPELVYMADTNRENPNSLWDSQNARLGSFLIASSFLVASFIALVTADKCIGVLVIHAVAALGGLIAALYTFMNFWVWITKTNSAQILHTWIVPFLFLVFWLVVWIEVNNRWSVLTMLQSVASLVILFGLLALFQKYLRKA